MTNIYVDASTLIALGTAGELELLRVFDGDIVIPERVAREVTTEPARENLRRFRESSDRDDSTRPTVASVDESTLQRASEILDEVEYNGDTDIIGGVLSHLDADESVAVVSDDRRVRTVADGLGATVTGTIGVIVRNVADGERTAEARKALVRRLDGHGLHMTGELREKADDLIEDTT